MLSCAKRPQEFMHLKPQSMQDIFPHSSEEKKNEKVHYYIIPVSLCCKALIVLSQQKHLMLYLNLMKFEKAPIQVT